MRRTADLAVAWKVMEPEWRVAARPGAESQGPRSPCSYE